MSMQFNSIWDAIADSAAESANLRIRAELMQQISAIIKEKNWNESDSADNCGLTQPRINELLRGQISKFSLDSLIAIAGNLGARIHITLSPHPLSS